MFASLFNDSVAHCLCQMFFPVDSCCNIREYSVQSTVQRTESYFLLRFCYGFVTLGIMFYCKQTRRSCLWGESNRTKSFLLVFQFVHSSDCRFNFYCRGHILDLYISSSCLHAELSVQDIHSFNRHFGLPTKETALCGMSADFSHGYYIYVG